MTRAGICDDQVLLIEPVVAADGESYERSAIEAWLAERGAISPATGVPLLHTQLVPNHALRSTLARMRSDDG